MRRGIIAAVILLIVSAHWIAPHSTAQDTDAERIAALETAVAELSTRVAVLEGDGSTETSSAATYTINGEFLLRQPMSDLVSNLGCAGYDGYEDVSALTDVVVRDGNGEVLAAGSLGYGDPVEIPGASASALQGHNCLFTFEIDVPQSEFYVITVGRRGESTHTFEELEANNWEVSLVLGNND